MVIGHNNVSPSPPALELGGGGEREKQKAPCQLRILLGYICIMHGVHCTVLLARLA